MATFFNQATLSYNGTVTSSNIASGEILSGALLTKTALSDGYTPDGKITYAISYTNTGGATVNGLTLTDDLGLPGGGTAYPLEYEDGSLKYFVNGVLTTSPEICSTAPLAFCGISVAPGSNVLLIYETRTTEYAPRESGSVITNNVTATNACGDNLTAEATVTVDDEVSLTISKCICPEEVSCGDLVNYTFVIQNTGNQDAVATDDITVTDVFNPRLTDITVTLNGEELVAGVGYTYDEQTGVFTTTPGVITIPAATFTTDPETGIVTTTPGVAVLRVVGTV